MTKKLGIPGIISICFFLFWLGILYAGADHPPPPGFIIIVIIDLGCSIVIYYRSASYQKWIEAGEKKLLLRVIRDGLAAGFIIALGMTLLPGGGEPSIPAPSFSDLLIWFGVLSVVGSINSLVVFWIVGYHTKKELSSHKQVPKN